MGGGGGEKKKKKKRGAFHLGVRRAVDLAIHCNLISSIDGQSQLSRGWLAPKEVGRTAHMCFVLCIIVVRTSKKHTQKGCELTGLQATAAGTTHAHNSPTVSSLSRSRNDAVHTYLDLTHRRLGQLPAGDEISEIIGGGSSMHATTKHAQNSSSACFHLPHIHGIGLALSKKDVVRHHVFLGPMKL